MKKKTKIVLLSILLVVVALTATVFVYLTDYSDGDGTAFSYIDNPPAAVSVNNDYANGLYFEPKGDYDTGVIFYPGARINIEAYAPYACSLAENGFLCVIVKMPMNLAVSDKEAADRVYGDFPKVSNWFIAGHSMGGTAAEDYALSNIDGLKGIMVLGSRITSDFSNTCFPVLSVTATNDGICTPELIEKNKTPIPRCLRNVVVKGGCHAYFGSYGPQAGDGEPEISWEEQYQLVTASMIEFINDYK